MTGRVHLVGAGPGDPELLTVKAHRLIEHADVILHDALTGEDIIAIAPPTATLRNVGKKPGAQQERTTQADINRLMVEYARSGRRVVRLKGGDPTVFGRGGEEAQHLATAGVPFEIVPGVSSVVAAPGIVGIPLTHREHASSLTVITGHEDPRKAESAIDWAAIARSVTAGVTLVILMGVGKLAANMAHLRAQGVDGETPVAVIEKATWADQCTVTGTLETIADTAKSAEIEPPAVTVVGDVVELRDQVAGHLAHVSAGSPLPPRANATETSSHPRAPVPENS